MEERNSTSKWLVVLTIILVVLVSAVWFELSQLRKNQEECLRAIENINLDKLAKDIKGPQKVIYRTLPESPKNTPPPKDDTRPKPDVSKGPTTGLPKDTSEPRLLAHYTFDTPARTILSETVDGPALEGFNGVQYTSLGHSGAAVVLDGNDDYLAAEDQPGPFSGSGPFTLMAWVYPESSKINTIVQQRDKQSVTGQYTLSMEGLKPAYYEYNSGYGLKFMGSQKAQLKEWSHVVFTRSKNGKGTLYLNGSVIGTETKMPKTIRRDRTFAIGCDFRGKRQFFHGVIDDVRVYEGALSSEEIQEIYNRYKTNP